MAFMYPIYLRGGPCDGRTVQISEAQFETHATVCGGVTYIAPPANLSSFTWQPATELEKLGAAVPGVKATDFNAAWSRLMHTLAFTLPRETKRRNAALHRIRRAVR